MSQRRDRKTQEPPFNPDQVWAEFYLKYPANKPATIERKKRYERKLSQDEKNVFDQKLKERDEKKRTLTSVEATTRIQRYWRKRREQDNLAWYNQIVMVEDDKKLSAETYDDKTIILQKDPESDCFIAFSYRKGQKTAIKKIKPENAKILIKKFEKIKILKKNDSNIKIFDQLLSLCGYSDLFTVNVNGNHSSDFVELVHNQKIKKSIHKRKLDILLGAISDGNWDNKIFQDPHLPQLAMSLFASGKITQQQTVTILERVQNFKDFQHFKTYSILDSKGQFTKESLEILIPSLSKFYLKKLNEEQLNEFRLLISKLPKSEQIFYTTNGNGLKDRMGLVGLDAIRYKSGLIINLSAGARDALGIAQFGLSNYMRMVPTLGGKTPKEIDQGIREDKRLGALSYPGTIPWQDIHGHIQVTNFEATTHDDYHSKIMSTFTRDMQKAFLELIDTVRANTKEDLKTEFSKEIWDWVDLEFNLLFHNQKYIDTERFRKNKLSMSETTKYFCDALLYGGAGIHRNYILPDSNLTPLGAIFILDILKNPEKWKKYNINLESLPENHPIKKIYQEIKNIYNLIEKDQPKIQIFKILLHQNLKNKKGGKDQFDTFSKLISSDPEINSKLKFKKITKKDIKDLKLSEDDKNSIYFSFSDIKINITNNNKVINKIVETVAPRIVGDQQSDQVNFRHAIVNLHYNQDEALRYVQYKRDKTKSENETQFIVKPTTWAWVKAHPIKSIFGLLIIPLIYGYFKSCEQDELNKTEMQSAISKSKSSPLVPIKPALTISNHEHKQNPETKEDPETATAVDLSSDTSHKEPLPPPSVTKISIFAPDTASAGADEECLQVGKIRLRPTPAAQSKSEQ